MTSPGFNAGKNYFLAQIEKFNKVISPEEVDREVKEMLDNETELKLCAYITKEKSSMEIIKPNESIINYLTDTPEAMIKQRKNGEAIKSNY